MQCLQAGLLVVPHSQFHADVEVGGCLLQQPSGNLALGMVTEATLMELFNGSLGAVFQNQTSQPCVQVSM